jgi:hypothetical protein
MKTIDIETIDVCYIPLDVLLFKTPIVTCLNVQCDSNKDGVCTEVVTDCSNIE